ncbi:MAG: hypothetical protein KC561_16105, partial [Myxococcales bacterium]|nr:hypothetical protein [Myxococcales bacterium]
GGLGVTPSRRLFAGEVDSPFVTYAELTDDGVIPLSADEVAALGLSLDELDRLARGNLNGQTTDWSVQDLDLQNGLRLQVAVLDGSPLAAEHILDPQTLATAAGELGATTVAVAVPRRGILLVTNAEQEETALIGFAGIVGAQFHRGESEPISPNLYAIRGTQLTAVMRGAAELGEEVANQVQKSVRPDGIEVYFVETPKKPAERSLFAGSGPFDAVLRALVQEAGTLLAQGKGHLPFDVLRCYVLEDDVSDLPGAADDALREGQAALAGFIRDKALTGPSGLPILAPLRKCKLRF